MEYKVGKYYLVRVYENLHYLFIRVMKLGTEGNSPWISSYLLKYCFYVGIRSSLDVVL